MLTDPAPPDSDINVSQSEAFDMLIANEIEIMVVRPWPNKPFPNFQKTES